MNRIITVKGIGKVSAKPDLVELSMKLSSSRPEYQHTMNAAAKELRDLQQSLTEIGFEKSEIKTADFQVKTDYESVNDGKGNYKRIFRGYICSQHLKLEFDFNLDRLAQTLNAIAKCPANPEFSIAFSVKDKNAVSEELIINAAENAKAKAELLTKAAGVTLGQIINIDYSWGEIHLYSPTQLDLHEEFLLCDSQMGMDIEPEDINASDSVTFVWEIL